MKRRTFSLLLALVFTCLLVAPRAWITQSEAASKSLLLKKKADLQQRIYNLQKKLRPIKQKQRLLSAQVHECELKTAKARQRRNQTRARLRKIKQEEAACDAQIARLELHYKQQHDRFGKRLTAYYKGDSIRFLDLLLGSRNIFELVGNAYLVSMLFKADARVLEQMQATKRKIQQVKAEKERQRQEYEIYVAQEQAELEEIKHQAWQQQAILDKVKHQRAAYEQYIAEFQADSKDIERELARLSGSYKGTLGSKWRGKLIRPCGGRVTSPFGWRTHPIFHTRRFHTGVDFGVPMNTPVKAAADGIVIFAGWKGAYGRCVIIDHGSGISTVYGHLNSFKVHKGSKVRQGQVIAYSGNTGLSTGPHLHFEVREHGKPVNPL